MIPAALRVMRKSRAKITITPKCQHLGVFPIYSRYLCFRCSSCGKVLGIRDKESLMLLSNTFFYAAQMLARGVVLGEK